MKGFYFQSEGKCKEALKWYTDSLYVAETVSINFMRLQTLENIEQIISEETIKEEIKSGFVFVMDYNEDRQVILRENLTTEEKDGFVQVIEDIDHANNHATIYLDTIGNIEYFKS